MLGKLKAMINWLDREKQTDIQIQDNGSDQGFAGQATVYNFTGTPISSTVSGSTANINIAGSTIYVVSTTADVVNNNVVANTIENVTGLSFPVVAGQRYWFRFIIHYDAAATTTGSRWSINGPAFADLNYRSQYALTLTSRTVNEGVSTYDFPATSNATSASTGSNMANIEGFILPSADGNVIARFASEVSASAITALRGSMVQYLPVG